MVLLKYLLIFLGYAVFFVMMHLIARLIYKRRLATYLAADLKLPYAVRFTNASFDDVADVLATYLSQSDRQVGARDDNTQTLLFRRPFKWDRPALTTLRARQAAEHRVALDVRERPLFGYRSLTAQAEAIEEVRDALVAGGCEFEVADDGRGVSPAKAIKFV